MKTSTTSKMLLPVLDSKGYTVCGTIGLANLEKRHRRKKVCKAAQDKRDKEKNSKDRTILSFLKPKATVVPSTVSSPVPVHGYKLAQQSNKSVAISTTPQGRVVSLAVLPVSGPIFNNFIKTLKNLVKELPI